MSDVYPKLRSFEHPNSAGFTVGSDHAFFKALHDRMVRIEEAGKRNASHLRKDIAGFAAEIRDHVEWLNKRTAEYDQESLAVDAERRRRERNVA